MANNFVRFMNKRIENTFVQNDNTVTILMFYNDTVFSNIDKECETQVAGLAQPYTGRFTLVRVRH
jgi:hypothetical protein